MYKLTQSETIIRLSDSAFIPPDPQNTDYAEYLKWVSEGNTPEPADPLPPPPPDWVGFYDSLLTSSSFSTAREAASTSLAANIAYTDCSTALSLARQGVVNVPAIQAGISSLLPLINLSPDEMTELSGLISTYKIPLIIE